MRHFAPHTEIQNLKSRKSRISVGIGKTRNRRVIAGQQARRCHSPDDRQGEHRLALRVVQAVVNGPLDGPEAIERDGDQREDGRERHAVVEEDPQAAHRLAERPPAEQDVERVERHGGQRHADVRHGQVDDVVREGGVQATLEAEGEQHDDVTDERHDHDEEQHAAGDDASDGNGEVSNDGGRVGRVGRVSGDGGPRHDDGVRARTTATRTHAHMHTHTWSAVDWSDA